MRIHISSTAYRDLDEIHDYWAERASLDVARDLIYAITARFGLFAESPNAGRKRDDVAPGIRSFPAQKYLIYYRKSRASIEILHIFHGARDQHGAFREQGPA